jgi:hypothetical protein
MQKRCDILQAKLDGVRGLGLKQIDFDCPTKLALFQPGQSVTFMGACHDQEAYYGTTYDDFDGFVFGWKGNRVRVVCEETDKPFCNILPNRLKPGPEPPRRVCLHCGMPEGIQISIKGTMDTEPRPWACRYDNSDAFERDPQALPCEYGEATDAAL